MIIFILIVSTKSFYQEESIIELDSTDSMISLTVNGTFTNDFPKKESGLKVKNITCNDDVIAYWDYESWGIRVRNLSQTRTKCQVDFVDEYSESILNGTDPVLTKGLIPVTIQDDGVVRKANLGTEWYRYENKRWANAVILEDESKRYYDGEVIPESNIESYFVWIPRYRYKIFNDGNYVDQATVENRVQTIEVEFENKNTSVSNGSTVGSWLTHPAFTNFNTNGLWIGKFEVGYKGATSTEAAEVNCDDSNKIQIKPNVYSWRNIQVVNAFTASYNYKRDMDSHMIKNTEWGAVVFLQHSKYGSGSSVRINNNASSITGYSAVEEPTCGYTGVNEDCNRYESTILNADGTYTKRYNTTTGYLASTTGNISGIYDMSGGAWEYVMGVMLDESGKPMSGRNELHNSGFNGNYGCPTCDDVYGNDTSKLSLTSGINFPDAKYYDSYTYSNSCQNYKNRILGDATGEMGPFETKSYGTQSRSVSSWYADESWFVCANLPWFGRGTRFVLGTGAGVFAFAYSNGDASSNNGFRLALHVSI